MTFIAKPYTESDEATVRSMQDKGFSVGAIARRLDRAESSVVACIDRLEKRDAAAHKQQRPCMCCGKRFTSDGPHNRLCGSCRTRQFSPYAAT